MNKKSQATFQLFDVLTSLCFINQSSNFNHSYKRSDWSKLACFTRVYSTILKTPQFAFRSGLLEIKSNFWRKLLALCHKTTQEEERNTRLSARVSPYTSFVLEPLSACFTTEQSTVKASLFVSYCGFMRKRSFIFDTYITRNPEYFP